MLYLFYNLIFVLLRTNQNENFTPVPFQTLVILFTIRSYQNERTRSMPILLNSILILKINYLISQIVHVPSALDVKSLLIVSLNSILDIAALWAVIECSSFGKIGFDIDFDISQIRISPDSLPEIAKFEFFDKSNAVILDRWALGNSNHNFPL